MFTPEQIALLDAPLDRKHVASRQQAGRSLSYLEGWHVIAEANRIFGFDAWDRETVELRQLGEPYQTPSRNGGEPTWRVAYMARVRVTVTAFDRAADSMSTIIREGCGFGSGIDRDLGQAHESALKEAETDAMKRALMTFGNPFGLALYDKTQANVAVAERAPAPPARRDVVNATSPQAPREKAEEAVSGIAAHLFELVEEISVYDLLSWAKRHDIAEMIEALDEQEKSRLRTRIKARIAKAREAAEAA